MFENDTYTIVLRDRYGYWGPYCPKVGGGFQMCHKGHGYGKMHGDFLLPFYFPSALIHSLSSAVRSVCHCVLTGPHMMEEWWVSSATQSGPEELAGWQRPFKRFRAVPHDVWLMSQPVSQTKQLRKSLKVCQLSNIRRIALCCVFMCR